MHGKIEVLDDTCSQTFDRKLEQYLSIYFCSQNPSKISKSNGCKGVYYSQKKHFLEEVWPCNLNLLKNSSTAAILRNLPFD